MSVAGGPASDQLLAGDQALASGDWAAARAAFTSALESGDEPVALAGLGEALWWLGEFPTAIGYRERAYAAYRRRDAPDDAGRAAELAVRLAIDHWANLGNAAAAAGWAARADRIVAAAGLAPLAGWVRLLEAYDAVDPKEAEALARQACEAARAHRDLDLELCALSQLGTALVGQGRVKEGLRHLDEAMAGALAGEGTPGTVVYTSCNTIMSGNACAAYARVVQWVRAADRFTSRYGCPYLFAYCRARYAAVLVAVGDWAQAEEELAVAIAATRNALPALHGEALAVSAGLRLCQGRLEEAERLVAGLTDHPAAAAVTARLALLRARPAQAELVARRRLADAGETSLRGMGLVALLGEARIDQGDPAAALALGQELIELGRLQECEVAEGYGERLCGQAYAAGAALAEPESSTIAPDQAREHLSRAAATFVRLGMPYEAARSRWLLATAVRHETVDRAAAEAQAAFDTFCGLGADRDADAAAALLRELGIPAARVGPRDPASLTSREREVLELLAEGLSNPEIAERLYLSRRTVEHHVARVLAKLGLRSRAEAAAEAVRLRAR
ncbi:helix-turn-helix transcriptional regulator [Natronosporangium hydrolyticum]|uniref:Helix-turn-helix transcriptional regulator n=1 Tax=Natronosporangium hydrolyticum TaxID=2811111 RepID=A0A895YAP3_9ACTN|nr:LuxR C-terminal-related transcriptional regulator [Natronosporangium hydrolyticum]QSB14461.1 helix-turn-helix transcriptional regulator [Natronosporangium hydrolyticum]